VKLKIKGEKVVIVSVYEAAIEESETKKFFFGEPE